MAENSLKTGWTRVGAFKIHTRYSIRPETAGSLPVALIHGMGVSSRYAIPTALRLAATHPVYAPDLPGHGRSSKPPRALNLEQLADLLIGWMDSFDLQAAAFVGNSFGCQVAISLAARYPERVDRLVLQGPTMDAGARKPLRQLGRFLLDIPREHWWSEIFVNLPDYIRCGLPRLTGTFVTAVSDRPENKLPGIDVPALVVRGRRDPIVSHEWAARVADLLPHGRLVELDGAHTLLYSQAEPFVNAISLFLREERRDQRIASSPPI
jgi:2-hydroxy-6-oxonona-2,4-dienedioate hydrolase